MIKKNIYTIIILFGLDAMIINISFLAAYFLRFSADVLPVKAGAYIPQVYELYGVLVSVTIILLAIFKLVGLYDLKRTGSLIDAAAYVLFSTSVAMAILFGMLFLYKQFWFSRLVILYAWLIMTFAFIFIRALFFFFQRWLYLKGIKVSRVIIVGKDEISQTLIERINSHPEFGYRIALVLEDNQLDNLNEVVKLKCIDEIIFASSSISHQKILDIITEFGPGEMQFRIVPGILEIIASRVNVDEIGEIPLIVVSDIQLKGLNALAKRTSDIIMAVAFIILLFPLFLFLAILIKLDSRGPVFLRQERIGKCGRPFYMYKFRSMVEDADQLFADLKTEKDNLIFKMKNDPRMTRVGRFLRRFSLDELPQLYNILCGQMSVIGPRPPLPREVINYNSWHKKRLRVAPGLTGLWQISGRADVPFDEMVRLDIYYIENWSLWFDFKIIFKTISVVLLGIGAY